MLLFFLCCITLLNSTLPFSTFTNWFLAPPLPSSSSSPPKSSSTPLFCLAKPTQATIFLRVSGRHRMSSSSWNIVHAGCSYYDSLVIYIILKHPLPESMNLTSVFTFKVPTWSPTLLPELFSLCLWKHLPPLLFCTQISDGSRMKVYFILVARLIDLCIYPARKSTRLRPLVVTLTTFTVLCPAFSLHFACRPDFYNLMKLTLYLLWVFHLQLLLSYRKQSHINKCV